MVDGEMMLHQIKTRFDSSVESPRSGNLGWLTGSKTSFSSNDGGSPGHAQCSRSAALFCVAQTRSRPCPVCPSVSPLPSPVCLLLSLSLSFSYKTPSARVWKSNPKSSVFPSQLKKNGNTGESEELIFTEKPHVFCSWQRKTFTLTFLLIVVFFCGSIHLYSAFIPFRY